MTKKFVKRKIKLKKKRKEKKINKNPIQFISPCCLCVCVQARARARHLLQNLCRRCAHEILFNSFQLFFCLFVSLGTISERTGSLTGHMYPDQDRIQKICFCFGFERFLNFGIRYFFFPHFHFNIRNCSTAILNRKSNFLLSPKEEYVHEERKKKKNKNKNTYKEKDRIIIILNCVKSLKQQQQRKEKIICFNESAYAIACFESARAP